MQCFVLATVSYKKCKKYIEMENGATAGWPEGATGWTQKKCASLRCPVLSAESKLMQLQEVPIGPTASSLVRLEAWH